MRYCSLLLSHSARVRRFATLPRRVQRFENRSIIVTGGGGKGAIGEAIVIGFLAEGGRVAVVDTAFPDDAGDAPHLLRLVADVSDEASVARAVSAASAAHDGVDILVNNAAAFEFARVDVATTAQWQRVLSVNVLGYANLMKYCIPLMRARGRGAVVNVSSMSGHIAQEAFVPYSTSKAAQLHMTRLVAVDEGKHNIRVNTVAPGPILTAGTARHAAGVGQSLERVIADMVAGLVIKRMGKPEEVASAVLFLASDEASFITGAEIRVDGGYTAL